MKTILTIFLCFSLSMCAYHQYSKEMRWTVLTIAKIEKNETPTITVWWQDENREQYPEFITRDMVIARHYFVGFKKEGLVPR
jgi:hypothetical protein